MYYFFYYSPIDAFSADTGGKYPRYKRAQYIEVDQLPGEMLVIPTGWYHQVNNKYPSITYVLTKN